MKLQKLSQYSELYTFIAQNEPVRLFFSTRYNDPLKPPNYFHIRSPEYLNYISAPAILYNKTIILATNRYDNIVCSNHIYIIRLDVKK